MSATTRSRRALLDDKFAPVTHHIGFLQAPLQLVVDGYARWHRRILYRVKRRDVNDRLMEALPRLWPLDSARSRMLFQQTTSRWVACFSNHPRGSDLATVIGVLAERLR